jgi:hypothetical protein
MRVALAVAGDVTSVTVTSGGARSDVVESGMRMS